MLKIGVIGIVVKGDQSKGLEIQKLLSEFSDIIIGRMGIPNPANNICVISVVVEGEQERISALSGKLGRLENVNIKSAIVLSDVTAV